jgi:isopenicillin N synthase-like dioxygenase
LIFEIGRIFADLLYFPFLWFPEDKIIPTAICYEYTMMKPVLPLVHFLTFSLLSSISIASKVVANNSDVIPLIDIQAWTSPSSPENDDVARREVATLAGKASKESGFFAIKNHGVNDTIMKNMWQDAQDFFDLPMEEKLRQKTNNETEYPYGYEKSETLVVGKCLGGKTNDNSDVAPPPPDLKETYSIGPSNPLAGVPRRRYPNNPPELKTSLDSYYREMEKLANVLLRIFAIALDLPETWFQDKIDKHMSALRILNYFEVSDGNSKPGQLRAGAHTDYGALTILKSGGPGLQVCTSVV